MGRTQGDLSWDGNHTSQAAACTRNSYRLRPKVTGSGSSAHWQAGRARQKVTGYGINAGQGPPWLLAGVRRKTWTT